MRRRPELIEQIDAYIPTLIPGPRRQPPADTSQDPAPAAPVLRCRWEDRLTRTLVSLGVRNASTGATLGIRPVSYRLVNPG
jgi:hypothetical protein